MFKSKNEFCLHLENIKVQKKLDTYLETILHFYESESDLEMDQIAKMLNRKIKERLENEAVDLKMIKSGDGVDLGEFL